MIQNLKKQWHLFLKSPPGHRFQDVHRRRKAKQGGSSEGRKHGMMVVGAVISVLGVVALPLPGPGTLVLAGGLMILAAESVVIARVLDRADEVRGALDWHGGGCVDLDHVTSGRWAWCVCAEFWACFEVGLRMF